MIIFDEQKQILKKYNIDYENTSDIDDVLVALNLEIAEHFDPSLSYPDDEGQLLDELYTALYNQN